MDQYGRVRFPLSLSLVAALAVPFGCGDSSAGDADGETSTSGTDSDSDSDSNTETSTTVGDGDGDPATGDGDGDGDMSGDGDGDVSGDGDGDMSGDGDGDMSGDGDGDMSGDGDGDMSGDGDGDMTGDGDGDDTGACQEFAGEVAPIPPSVMLLLDRSGSMTEMGFDNNDPGKTRWQALYEAVDGIVAGNDAQIAFGAKTFSTQGQGACGVSVTPDVDIELDNAANILAGIPGPMEQVNGGTPTVLALEVTMSIMEFYDAGDSDKIIFLITDGRIGCLGQNDTDDSVLAEAVTILETGLDDHDITTYVVGIAPSQFGPIQDQLNGMAVAGGAPKPGLESFYRADDADQLVEALDQVLEDSYGKSCLLDLQDPPFFPEYTKVVVGDVEYELVDNCDTDDGFVYTNMESTQIQLCGQACTDLGELPLDENPEVQFFCDAG